MSAMHLIRIEPARNMRRFYRLDVQPDLFGGFAVVKEWGRIGARGQMMDELHATEALAAAAMQRQADRKCVETKRGKDAPKIILENVSSHTARRSLGHLDTLLGHVAGKY
jgi:predicted DNA-binding WGR domain protein